MWKEGEFEEYSWQAKVYDKLQPSGLNGGRIIKLVIWNTTKEVVFNYDRGLDLATPKGRKALKHILSLYPDI